MSKIYLREGEVLHGKAGYGLIRQAVCLYLGNSKYKTLKSKELEDVVKQLKIEVYELGKPYFANLDIEFSLSHTGLMWMCIFDEKPCGIDIQQVKSCKFEAIADRHFSENEIAYVNLWGEEGFFEIWTAKEAFGKYTGKGIFGEKESLVDDNHELKQEIAYEGKTVYVKKIELSPDLKCTYCTESDEMADVVLL